MTTNSNNTANGDNLRFMQRAIQLAQQAAGGTLSPRPHVADATSGKHNVI